MEWVLPVAFYELYMWYPPMIPLSTSHPGFVTNLVVNLDHLSDKDKVRFHQGKEILDSTFAEAWDTIRDKVRDWRCENGSEKPDKVCAKTLENWVNAAAFMFFQCRFTRDLPRNPIKMLDTHALRYCAPEGRLPDAACESCRMFLGRTIDGQRLTIWSSLPKIFNLSDELMEDEF